MSSGLPDGASGFVPHPLEDRASVSRVLLAYSGHSHTFAADRAISAAVAEAWPGVLAAAQAHRGFLAQAVEVAALDAPEQLVDIGAGIAHERDVAHEMRSWVPDARMVLVDSDPVAVAHHRYVWGADPRVAVVNADATAPGELLARLDEAGVVDFGKPVLAVLGLLLHFLTDEQAHGLVSALRDRMVPRSVLAVSHVTDDPTASERERAGVKNVLARYHRDAIGTPVVQRSAPWLAEVMDGLVHYRPGITDVAAWARRNQYDPPSAKTETSDTENENEPSNENDGNNVSDTHDGNGRDGLRGLASSFVLGAVGVVPFPATLPPAGV